MLRILGIVSAHLRPSLGPPICRFAALTLALALATPAVAAEVGGDAALRPSGELLDEQEGPERPPPTDAGAPASSEARAGGRDDGRRTLGRFFPNLGRSAIGVFHRDNLGPLVVGTVATGLGSFYDDDVRDHISDPGNGFGKNFEDGASPALVGAAVVGVFVGGRLAEGPRFRAMSYDLLDAFVVNGTYTILLKKAVQRERPNGEDDKSFPSGHVSNAFALAAVAERHYGWKVGSRPTLWPRWWPPRGCSGTSTT